MTRAEFQHAVRAAASVLGVTEVLVIESQALHASVADDLPPEASRSVEVDVAALRDDPDGAKAEWISKAIAGRPKDIDFCAALVKRRLVGADVLRARLTKVKDIDKRVRTAVDSRIPR